MAAVSLFWDTNMTAVESCENTLYTGAPFIFGSTYLCLKGPFNNLSEKMISLLFHQYRQLTKSLYDLIPFYIREAWKTSLFRVGATIGSTPTPSRELPNLAIRTVNSCTAPWQEYTDNSDNAKRYQILQISNPFSHLLQVQVSNCLAKGLHRRLELSRDNLQHCPDVPLRRSQQILQWRSDSYS